MRKLLWAGVVSLLAACAGNPFGGYDIAPGTPREAVVSRMGAPYRVVPLAAGGQRLQYSLQPYGQLAWMVDLDAAGRVTQARQVLTEGNFHRIEPGRWNREDVEREFGRPAWVDGVASWNGPIMTYRWRDLANSDMFYYVYLDPQGVVRRAHPGMEFLNAPNDRD
ncbi:MAG: hypothetical protein EOO27_48355 [Comamonadaceae bacterium]|nr:MAG: hypothetical protein EOO27_48355 [Comamonadaceae bacterium]